MTQFDLSNPDSTQFKHLLDAEAAAMFLTWRRGATVCEFSGDGWYPVDPTWTPDGIYSIRPAKQLIAPWKWLAPWIKSVAMDADKTVYGYEVKPICRNASWTNIEGRMIILSTAMKFDTDGIDGRESLTLRPEGK